jgi:8-oxo-dGTP pyrophosphatase MutT (NUDIX family)
MENNEKLVEDFINYYQSLSEGEKFKLGGKFNALTGGKLSPYDSPTPVAVALIQVQTQEGIKLLGVRRGIMPKIHELAFPGGFVNKLENTYTAGAREGLEETGLETNEGDYEIIDSKIAPSNTLLLFLLNKNVFDESIMDKLVLNNEVEEFVLIDATTDLCFPLHNEVKRAFFASLAFSSKD